jgi:prepilin-type N-terminal cleavage/methylation domain-containing protein
MALAGNKQTAFSLVELLVAMALLAIVVSILASIFSSTQKGVSLLGSASSQRRDASTVLDQISRDLRSALEPVSRSFEEVSPSLRTPQLLLNPAGFSTNQTSLFWSVASESKLGGTTLVGYTLRWEDTPDGSRPRPRLCRVSFDPNDSESIKKNLRMALNTPWVDQALANANAPGDSTNGYQGWISDNILAFYARVLDPQMNPITNYARTLSAPAAGTSSTYAVFGSSANGTSTLGAFDSAKGYQYTRVPDNVMVNRFGPALPAAIELVVVTAPPSSIQKLTSIPAPVLSGNATTMWTDINSFLANLPEGIRKASRTFSTIVPLSVQQ